MYSKQSTQAVEAAEIQMAPAGNTQKVLPFYTLIGYSKCWRGKVLRIVKMGMGNWFRLWLPKGVARTVLKLPAPPIPSKHSQRLYERYHVRTYGRTRRNAPIVVFCCTLA